MHLISDFSEYVSNILGIDKEYIKLTILTIFVILIAEIIKWIVKNIYSHMPVSDKKKFFRNRKSRIIITVISFVVILLIWGEKLNGIITLVSFISAGVTIAIREIIFNFFAGIYINMRKPFDVEDRVEIDEIKGDVINTHALSFEMLEIGERNEGEQSTGRIVHIPNSYIFTKTLKNYTKAFKYIWDEIKIELDLDANIEETKEKIYDILFENPELQETPKKMEDAVDEAILEYRIYYNNLEPIIYTTIKDSHVELCLRYLVHPKKARNVQDEITLRILEENKKGNIKLYKDN